MNYYNYNQSQETVTPKDQTTMEESILVKALSPQDVQRILEIIVDGLNEFKKLPLNLAKEKEIEESQRKKKLTSLSYNRMSRI